ncbi:MerR family transcriptional regulator [Streptomyces sp. NPDC050145]|uniref:MerR family transcriptional regulator n=1 Tax=Streptomyces sp. NPDC050145 TaxID=3365602 RepID=UPI00379DFFC1
MGFARLRTVDVARATGYSVQQVRDLERLGVLPPAARAENGYRGYTDAHVRALHVYRGLAVAVGPVEARRLLARLRTVPLEEAAAAVDVLHAGLARERDEVLAAERALELVEAEVHRAGFDGEVGAVDSMTIAELAQALGVRPSALRFWEEQGLVVPERVTSRRARRYGPAAIGAARVVVALRGAGHGIPAVRDIVAALDGVEGRAEARRALTERLESIAVRSIALLRAGADLAALIEDAAQD